MQTFNIDANTPCRNVLHLVFDTKYAVASSMMRLQEFYESPFPDIRNSFFSTEAFMDIYARENKNFTYTLDWDGFNVPSDVFYRWATVFGNNNALLPKEKELIACVLRHAAEFAFDEDFYIIATCRESVDVDDIVRHEICHALYALDKKFKSEAMELVKLMPEDHKEKMFFWLGKRGYCRDVLLDETIAYMSTSDDTELSEIFKKLPKERIAFRALLAEWI